MSTDANLGPRQHGVVVVDVLKAYTPHCGRTMAASGQGGSH